MPHAPVAPRGKPPGSWAERQSGGPHAGFAFGDRFVVVHGGHAPGWRNTRAARDLPDDVRIRQAAAVALPHRPGRGRELQGVERIRHEFHGTCHTIRHRPVPPSIRLLRVDRETRMRGRVRWLAWPDPEGQAASGARRPPPPPGVPPHVTANPRGLPPAWTATLARHPAAGVAGVWQRCGERGKDWGVFRPRDWNGWGWAGILSTFLAWLDPSFRHPRACPRHAKRRVRGATGRSGFPLDRWWRGGRL